MSKKNVFIQELTDRVCATEAICKDLLARVLGSDAQAQIKFDDYRIKYTQEAVERREAEAKAKLLKINLNTAKADFRDIAGSKYWSLVFVSKEEQEQILDEIWLSITQAIVLPEGTERPHFDIAEPTVEQLINRRTELTSSIDRVNDFQLKHSIEHCSQSIEDFKKQMTDECKRQVIEIQMKKGRATPEAIQEVKETETEFDNRISQHTASMNRQIDSAKAGLARLEADKAELKEVEKALGKLLTDK